MPSSVLEFPFGWSHLIATTQVSIAAGTLHSVVINCPDPLAGSTITIYDSEAGADPTHIIANITVDDANFVIPATLIYDVQFDHGLYFAFSAGITTADITVAWR